MAITNAQQYKQLVNKPANGKRPGYRGVGGYRGGPQGSGGGIGREQAGSKGSGFETGRNVGRDPNEKPAYEMIGGQKVSIGDTLGKQRALEKSNIFERPKKFGGLRSLASKFNPLSFILGLINPALGLASRIITQKVPETFQTFKESETLEEFRDKMRGYGRTMPTIFNNPNLDLLASKNMKTSIGPSNLNDYEGLTNLDFINRISESDMSLTPEQKEVIKETPKEQDFTNFENAMFASAKPLDYRIGLSNKTTKAMLDSGFNIDGSMMTPEEKMEYERQKKEMEQTSGLPTEFAADGGMIGGGIMDAAGRQQYFLGKLVKKATRAVKKIVKSPVGKIGLLAAGGLGLKSAGLLSKLYTGGKLTGMGKLALGAGISSLPLLFGQEEEEQPTGFTGSVGGNIDPRAYTDPYSVLFPAFRAEGSPKEGEKGIMKVASNDANERLLEQLFEQFLEEGFSPAEAAKKAREAFYDRDFTGAKGGDVEPVAKKTMPLLDMGGQEMDLRAEGGFVPIGRMEKADDVPARLSKNEFVFTADAVRNAGDGDVDKGAEVMYNMMKNLEAGGDVSEESQGLEGARNMFQTSKRLEEVI
jgi:hypothetical protein